MTFCELLYTESAQTDHRPAVANGSTDPTFGVDFARNPPNPLYVGFSVNIPLRIFDRSQGEKARTELDIQRSRRLREATWWALISPPPPS